MKILLVLAASAYALVVSGQGDNQPLNCTPQPPMIRVMALQKRPTTDQPLSKHRCHSNDTVIDSWYTEGFITTRSIGKVINPNLSKEALTTFKTVCPSLRKLHAFMTDEAVILTADESEVQDLYLRRVHELPLVGYCSETKACGATRNLRSVNTEYKDDFVYSTNDDSLNKMNNQPRYKGTLSSPICWLF